MNHHRRLENKIALITGAASGIGRATAELFAEEGAKLVLGDLNNELLDQAVAGINQAGEIATGFNLDVSQESKAKEFVDISVEKYGRVDILVNNAGIPGTFAYPDEQDAADWQRVLNVNLMGAVFTTKYAFKQMKKEAKGAIVNVASVAGIRSGAGGNAYSASKAALINFTQTVACDGGEFNIRVNAVCPGLVETGMTKPFFDIARDRGKIQKLGNRCELRRYGLPKEIAYAILFFAGDESSYVTGQALPVDGGNTASLNMPGMKV